MSALKEMFDWVDANDENAINRVALLEKAGDSIQLELSGAMSRLYLQVADELILLANKPENRQSAVLYFDALREIQLRGSEFVSIFTVQFLSLYQSSCRDGVSRSVLVDTACVEIERGASLVKSGGLEEQLAIASITNNFQDKNIALMNELSARYTCLLRVNELPIHQLPLSLHVICSAFQMACHIFDIAPKIKMVMYTLLGTLVENQLPKMYEDINVFLFDQGIVTDYCVESNVVEIAFEQQDALQSNSDLENNMSFNLLYEQLNQQCDVDGIAIDGVEPLSGVFYYPGAIVAALSQMQSADTSRLPVIDLLLFTLGQQPNAVAGAGISIQERKIIEQVKVIFDYVKSDQQLPDCIKSIISRLHVSVLKVAILDDTFFSDEGHPVRLLLNDFIQAGIMASDEVLEEKIRSLVEHIINEFTDDISLFTSVLARFHHLMSGEQLVNLEQQHVELRGETLRQLQIQAEGVVDKLISRCKSNHHLPGLLQEFISDVWRELLINTHMQEGEGSHVWGVHRQLTEDFFWSIEPKISHEERDYLAQMIPHVVNMLSDSLVGTTWDKLKVDALFESLRDRHQGALQGSSSNDESAASSVDEVQSESNLQADMLKTLGEVEHEEIVLDDQSVVTHVVKPAVELDAKPNMESELSEVMAASDDMLLTDLMVPLDYYDERVIDLKLGSWVEFTDGDEVGVKAKLVWRGEIDRRLIFANWKHEIVRRCNERELATMLREWNVIILKSAPMLDRALSSVMGALTEGKGVN